jgi:hypothetical protein
LLLAAGIADRDAPFRTLGLATVATDGTPDVRIVVLRGFDAAARRLSVHTDARSAKCRQLHTHPAVALLGWDPARRLQVRLHGRAAMHSGDAVARAAWDALTAVNRQLYRLRQAPGSPLPDPSPAHYAEGPEALGFAAFVVLEVAFDRLETLRLTDQGQVRARFDFAADAVSAAWLVP